MPVTRKQIDRIATTAAKLLALEIKNFSCEGLAPPQIFWDPRRRRRVVGDRGTTNERNYTMKFRAIAAESSTPGGKE